MGETNQKLECDLGGRVPKKKNPWKVIALIELMLMISGGIIFSIYSMGKESLPTMKAQEDKLVSLDDSPQLSQETYRMNGQLSEQIATYSNTLASEFIPSVTDLFGYEYLKLSNGKIDIYYRNEFPKEDTSLRQRIMIDNGTKMVEFNWDYDLNQGIASLIPYYGEFFLTGEAHLVFTFYDKTSSSTVPEQLRCVGTKKLLELEPYDLAKQLEDIFTISYEDVGNDPNHPDTRMNLSIGAAIYSYAIGQEDYVNAVYYDEALISHDKYFNLDVQKDQIQINSIPYLSEEEYLGEISARIIVNDDQLVLSNVSYATYAKSNQEDETQKVIIPRSTILGEDRISLWGFHNETFLLELSKKVPRNQIKQEDLITDENGFKHFINSNSKSILGIDVSKYQGNIDWKQVKEAGVEFAILRVGFRGFNEGTLELDPYFERNIKAANEQGIHVGVYFFSQAINEEEAIEEAQFVLNKIKDHKITYPVVIDTEHVTTYDARANKLPQQVRTNVVKTFCEEIKRQGYEPMIYANTKWLLMGVDLEQLTDYDIWFAYYGNNLNFPYEFDIYQYSAKGKIPGIKGDVDLNFSLKDYSEISR